jgi:putative nucleotidyltransferase with HDIG domain
MLGVVRVRRLAQAVFTLRDARQMTEGLDWRHLWVHAFATAAIAEELERRLRPSAESGVHLAALLHDVGKIVLSTVAAEEYRAVLVAAWNGEGRLEDLERARLGVEHREAGGVFARRNQLPSAVVEAIAYHATPDAAEHHRFEVALVSLANHLSKAYGLGFSGARLDECDGEFAELPAWKVLAETVGCVPDAELLEEALADFIAGLRVELRALREAA